MQRTDTGGSFLRSAATAASGSSIRRLWPSALAAVALVLFTATTGLAQTGRLRANLLGNGTERVVDSATGAADTSVTTVGQVPPVPAADRVAPLAVPRTATRLVPQTPDRVVDSREGDEPPPAPGTAMSFTLDDDDTVAVMISVSVMNASQPGAVLVDGRAGVVEAARLPEPGATTTNLVVVPVEGSDMTIRSSAGGHLVADIVGRFTPVTEPVASGRFVAVAPLVVAELETAVEGRELDIALSDIVLPDTALLSTHSQPPPRHALRRLPDTALPDTAPLDSVLDGAGEDGGYYGAEPSAEYEDDSPGLDDASAVLAVVTADVGTEGGMVRLGPTQGDFDQILMWAPAVNDDRQRQALVLLEPTDDLLTSLRYDGGTELTVEVVGYFTGEETPAAQTGLFLPTGPTTIFDGPLANSVPADAAGLRTDSGSAWITVAPRAGIPGQLGSSIVQADYGTVQIAAPANVDATVILLGEFLS